MNDHPLILGLAGTNGSGKDTVGRLLNERDKFLFVTITEILRQSLRREGKPPTRENLRTLSGKWRSEHGLGVLIDRAMDIFNAEKTLYKGVVIGSLRNPGEVDRIHELGGKVIWIDAKPEVRYDRIQKNAISRDRIEEDNVTYEQFVLDEQAEMENPVLADSTRLNMGAVKEKCDVFIDNSTGDIEQFYAHIEKVIQEFTA